MRKFAVRVVGPFNAFRCYLIEAETAQMAEEVIQPEVDPDAESVYWGEGQSREWREAWRAGLVTVLKDRKLPEGVE